MDVLEERTAEIGVGTPVRAHHAFGDPHHRHDRKRDERHQDEQRESGRQRQGRQDGEQRERRQNRVEQLREVLPEIALELLDALDADLDRLARGDVLAIGASQAHELVVDLLAHGLPGLGGGALAHALGERLAHGAHDDGGRARGEQRREGGAVGGSLDQILDERADQQKQRYVRHEGDPLKRHVGDDAAHRPRHHRDESLVEHGIPHTVF